MTLHSLKGFAATREVYLDGKLLDPKPSQEYYNHSPDGFNWGYGGSGPAQLALAVMIALGNAGVYQEFKWEVIAALPQGQDFDINFEYGWHFTHNITTPTVINVTEDVKALDDFQYFDKNGVVIEIGDEVDVPDSESPDDLYSVGFRGYVDSFHGDYVTVKDQDDDAFDIEPSKLEVVTYP